jgi:hypothetical protein
VIAEHCLDVLVALDLLLGLLAVEGHQEFLLSVRRRAGYAGLTMLSMTASASGSFGVAVLADGSAVVGLPGDVAMDRVGAEVDLNFDLVDGGVELGRGALRVTAVFEKEVTAMGQYVM